MSKKDGIVNGFNNVFTNVGPQLSTNFPLPKQDKTIYQYVEENIEHSMFLDPVDDLEIIRTVQNYKNKRSTDFSDVSISQLKKVISKIVKPFFHICNVSFQTRGVDPVLKVGGTGDQFTYTYICILYVRISYIS